MENAVKSMRIKRPMNRSDKLNNQKENWYRLGLQ